MIYTGVTVTGSSVGTRQELRDLLDLGAAIGLSIDIERIPLSKADEALDRLERGEVDGRQVIDFSLD